MKTHGHVYCDGWCCVRSERFHLNRDLLFVRSQILLIHDFVILHHHWLLKFIFFLQKTKIKIDCYLAGENDCAYFDDFEIIHRMNQMHHR